MDLIELLKGNIPQDMLSVLSQQTGADSQQTQTAAQGVISTILGGLAKNASTQDGAEGILGALNRDHDGSVLGNIGDLLGGVMGQNKSTDGAGILGHILGAKQDSAADMISQASGVDKSNIIGMMLKFAPIIMGVLGKAKTENNLDAGGLASILSGAVNNQQVQEQNPLIALASKFLDKDGDGSMMDDLGGIGMNILGGMFKK